MAFTVVHKDLKFEILFEDQHLIVISKAAGLLSQGDHSGDESLVDLLRIHFGRNYVGLVHRLDRNTSGAMVVAKRSKAADRLTEQLKSGKLIRKYQAILFGTLSKSAHWKNFLIKNEQTNEVRIADVTNPKAKNAELDVSPIRHIHFDGHNLTLAEFILDTGRSHQIRVQAAAHNLPLVGDRKYGNANSLTLFDRPALHSHYIEFEHPMSHERMALNAPWPDDARQRFSKLI